MNNQNSTAQPKDYPSIEAFLGEHLPHATMAMMSSDGYPQTIKGVNAIMVMASTRGTSRKIGEAIRNGSTLKRGSVSLESYYHAAAIHVESESTPTHATLTFLCMAVRRNTDGIVAERFLPQRAFPVR